MANRPDALQSSRKSQCSSASVRTTWLYRPDAIQCLDKINYITDAANRDSTVQSEVRRISKFPPGRCVIPSGRPSVYCSISPNDVSFRRDTYIISRSFCTSLLHPDISTVRPDAYQFLNGSLILSKFKKVKINQPSGRCGIPSGLVSP
jgi:hypothetical protein